MRRTIVIYFYTAFATFLFLNECWKKDRFSFFSSILGGVVPCSTAWLVCVMEKFRGGEGRHYTFELDPPPSYSLPKSQLFPIIKCNKWRPFCWNTTVSFSMVFVNTEIFSQRHEACRNYLAARQLKESFAFSLRETDKERGNCEAD